MDQFKVQAAMSSMATPVTSSTGSSEQAEGAAKHAANSQAAQAAQAAQAQPVISGGHEANRLDSLLSSDFPKGDRGSQHHPVAEFLYQLTKMLTDDNSEIIEWVEGRIKVHHPERLEAEVLHKYFRHSKFASFQRQLNYFGFRKIAGKGKMSPCSYVNESATTDIRSLLLIKRKTNGSAARKAMAQRALSLHGGMNPALGTGLPGLAQAAGQGLMGGMGQNLAALNQYQMQKQALGGLGGENAALALLMQNQQRQSWNDLQQLGGLGGSNMPTIEQLQAQIASLSKSQHGGGSNPALNAAALNFASAMNMNGGGGYSQYQGGDSNPATAALNAASSGGSGPATAAMNAAGGNPAGHPNSLFESATNLKALIGNDHSGPNGQGKGPAQANHGMMQRLPSSNGMFNGSVSNASLGNLLASSNRLSSLLSLNSFLSREPSLADFAMMPNGAQLAALASHQQQQQQQTPQEMASRYNQSTV
jgi:hypothetical protein